MAEKKKFKTPPASKESEMMVLGSMLTSEDSLAAADILQETDFYYSEHKIIFRALKEAFHKDKPADVHIIAETLKKENLLEEAGSISYLTTLAQYAGTSAYVEEYANIIKDKAILRKMIDASEQIMKSALTDEMQAHDVLDDAQAKFFQISQSVNTGSFTHIKEFFSGTKNPSKIPYLKELQEKQEEYLKRGPSSSQLTGIPTHFTDLDKIINGFDNSNLIILAARPAMGKTALALGMAENICFKNDLPVAIFSLEMTAEQLLHRMICSQAEIESEKIKTGALNGNEYQRIVGSVNEMMKHNLIIDDQPGLKITDLRARARRLKESHGIGFLIIDYLQLLSGSGTLRSSDNRQNEISEISRMLKTLARELNIPILCLSQLSRKVEERTGHRPMMSDLRESGCVTADTQIKDAETGEIYTIKELAERKQQKPVAVYGVDKNLKIGKYKMTRAFYSGRKQVFELKTRSGKSIKASANHPFLRLGKWTRLDELKAGDKIALPKRSASPAHKQLSDKELILLADVIKNGCSLPKPPYHLAADAKSFCSFNSRRNSWQHLDSSVPAAKNRCCSFEAGREGWPSLADNASKHSGTAGKNTTACFDSRALPADIFFDEIASITKLAVEDVYDATVAEVHNFVANDIVIHNSIEQDSDQVMFLLRREYYDPYDKPGQAELIVAKNRHGQIGSVNLTFRKEIAQFANYSLQETPKENPAFAEFTPPS